MALFFGACYYAGYGQIRKASIFAIINVLIPFSNIFVNIYAGLNAQKDLPIGKQPFMWKPAIGIFAVTWIAGSIYFSILSNIFFSLPSCGNSDVENLISDIISENWNLEFVSLDEIEETGFNKKKGIRACVAALTTSHKTRDITYSIKWENRKKENYYVEVQLQ